MERKRTYIYPDKASMTAAFVCEVQRFLNAFQGRGKQLHIALSGGSTPVDIFRQLAEQTSAEDWSDIHLYWGDERCVPSSHPDSNYGSARKAFLDVLDLDLKQIHPIRGYEDPQREAEAYGDLLQRQLPLENGFPVFDWIWLGLGTDGHTASIFPQEIELWTSGTPCVATRHPQSGQSRVSLSGGTLNAARRVSFILSGESKARVVREIFKKEGGYMSYPAFYVNPSSGNLEWYLDQDAAKLL
jgi:6-phosphogluconolactonase